MRDSVVFYRSFWEAIKDVDPPDQLAAYNAIFDYALDDISPNLKGAASAIFKLAKPQIDANNKRYENGKRGGRPTQKNNQAETKPKPRNNQAETKPEPNVNVNVNENVNVNDKGRDIPGITNDNTVITHDNRVITNDNTAITHDNTPITQITDTDTVSVSVSDKDKKKRVRFTPPTLEEVEAYCKERNSPVNPKDFYDYFDTGHWIDSKGEPVRNWKQKLITWENHAKGKPPDRSLDKPKGHFKNERIYDFEAIERDLVKGATQ